MQPDAGVQPGHERDEPQHHGEIEEKLPVPPPQADHGERDQLGDGEAEHGQLRPAPPRGCWRWRGGMHRGRGRHARQPNTTPISDADQETIRAAYSARLPSVAMAGEELPLDGLPPLFLVGLEFPDRLASCG